MIGIETKIKGVFKIQPEPLKDSRGMFIRTFCKEDFKSFGLSEGFVQINHSYNTKRFTFRGLHYQKRPGGDVKLIRCIQGSVIDILLDLRIDSPTFLETVKINLSKENLTMVLVPAGVAHGFLTIEFNSELIYHHTSYYDPKLEAAINYKDPRIKLQLPNKVEVISEKDCKTPFINEYFNGY